MRSCTCLTIVSYVDYPSPHGLSNRVGGVAKTLARKGVECNIICPSTGNSLLEEDLGFAKVWRIPSGNGETIHERAMLSRAFGILKFMLKSFVYVTKLTKNKSDVIMVEQVVAIPLLILIRLFHRRLAIVDDMTLLHPDYRFAPKPILQGIDMICIAFSDMISTTTEKTVDFLRRRFPKKKCVMARNGVNVIALPLQAFERAGLKTPITMLFVGGLGFYQNVVAVEHIMSIATIIASKMIDFRIVVVGGPLDKVSRFFKHELVEKGIVSFEGKVSDKVLDRHFSQSLIGLLPFFEDAPLIAGQRTKALEYLARGLLVVSGPEGVGEVDGLIPNIHYLANTDDLSFVRQLEQAISDPQAFVEMRRMGHSLVCSSYSWAATTSPIADYIEEQRFSSNTN